MIALKTLNRTDQNAEVGYWVARDFWRRGIATEALRLILTYAFDGLKLRRVYAVVQEGNVSSVQLLEKIGFVREGPWRQGSFMDGRFRDVYAYGMLSEEFVTST